MIKCLFKDESVKDEYFESLINNLEYPTFYEQELENNQPIQEHSQNPSQL